MLNLDTHVLLYALTDDLTPRERALLSHQTWSISAIVLWAIAKLSELGRVEMELDHPELVRNVGPHPNLAADPRYLPFDQIFGFRQRSADEIIAATSLVHRVPLITRDRKMRRSKIVPFAS
jgi:PIN domain nuclease of toxin-antitoxin system